MMVDSPEQKIKIEAPTYHLNSSRTIQNNIPNHYSPNPTNFGSVNQPPQQPYPNLPQSYNTLDSQSQPNPSNPPNYFPNYPPTYPQNYPPNYPLQYPPNYPMPVVVNPGYQNQRIVLNNCKLAAFLILFIISLIIAIIPKIRCSSFEDCYYSQTSSYYYQNYNYRTCSSIDWCLYFSWVLGIISGTGVGYLILNAIIYLLGTRQLKCYHIFLYSKEFETQSYWCCWGGVIGLFFPVIFVMALVYFIYYLVRTCRRGGNADNYPPNPADTNRVMRDM